MITIPGRIPITITPYFPLMAAIIGVLHSGTFAGTLVWMVVIFLSVLTHELGHATTAILFGRRARITLIALGGVTQHDGRRLRLWQDFLVTLNGPLFGILLALIAHILLFTLPFIHPLLTLAFYATMVVNIVWSILNLLPVGPLDGGQILKIFFESVLGARGIKISYLIGLGCGILFALASFALQQHFLGILFFMLSFESLRSFQGSRAMTELDRNEDLIDLYHSVQEDLKQDNKEQGIVKLQMLRDRTQSGLLFNASSELLGHLFQERGEFEEAYAVLLPVEKHMTGETVRLLHRLAHYMRDNNTIAKLADRSFQIDRNPDTAFLNAQAFAQKEEVKSAIGWLQCAKNEGLEVKEIREKLETGEFDAIRNDPRFLQFESSLDR